MARRGHERAEEAAAAAAASTTRSSSRPSSRSRRAGCCRTPCPWRTWSNCWRTSGPTRNGGAADLLHANQNTRRL